MARRAVQKMKKGKGCALCGGRLDLKGTVCSKCNGGSARAAARRVAERVRDRLVGGGAPETGDFVCPYCRQEITWQTIGTSETEVTIYVREKIYYCPGCRAFLGVSSWHTEG
jgi:uncharacterized protein with PIN domain